MGKTDKKLPIGVDIFEKLIHDNYYYLDKTGFISRLIKWHGAVNLFVRPRRFGKTLNMSMLKSFFGIGMDQSLFDGLEISASLDAAKISEFDRERLNKLIRMDADVSGMKFAPAYLMRILRTYYGKQVILLIDEYDVPLDKANSRGYYDRMVDFLRGF